jgi:hypothetical protein
MSGLPNVGYGVISGKAQIEHKFSGLPPATDIRQRGWHVGSVPIPDSCTAASAYSITSSASCWRCKGTSRPRAFAVFRLMTNSNLVGS